MILGADPEFFVKDKITGKIKSAVGLVGGTKESPKRLIDSYGDYIGVGFYVLEDNVAIEYNIDPAHIADNFKHHIAISNQTIKDTILRTKNLEISTKASHIFDDDELESSAAWIFGCEPDYNAYKSTIKLVKNPKPVAKNKKLRSVGGHIHVSHIEALKLNPIKFVKKMDLFLGVPSILLDNSEGSKERRELYGKAGSFRLKPYGIEYRTLSNFWIWEDGPDWVWNMVERAENEKIMITPALENKIENSINTSNLKSAEALCKKYNLL
jgi:hypothetical protein